MINSSQRSTPLLYVNKNQDGSMFSMALQTGYRIFNADPPTEQQARLQVGGNGGLAIVEMLCRTNILALVGGGRSPRYPPNRLVLWDDSKATVLAELEFNSIIKSVRLRRDLIVVVLVDRAVLFTMSTLPVEIAVFETADNDEGLVALSGAAGECERFALLALPGRQPGHVQLVTMTAMDDSGWQSSVAIINAHQTAVACLQLNHAGTMLATASKKGTLIRIFRTDTGRLVSEFRRGSDQAQIWTIAFSNDSQWLAVGSDKGTVHIFKLSTSLETAFPNTSTATLAETAEATASNRSLRLELLRDLLPKYFSSEWSFAYCHVPADYRFLCFFECNQSDALIIITADGNYYKFVFDTTNGGLCNRLLFHRLLKPTV